MASDPMLASLAALPDGWHTAGPLSRRAAMRDDPLLFAFYYLGHHLRSEATDGRVTFSEVHYEWAARAKRWLEPVGGPMADRHADVAPRETGKSTWHFLILPMWAAAFGHRRFAAAFADSATQAEQHLATFKHELDTNERLRRDFPDLVAPARRPRGVQVADRQNMLFTSSGFVFAARGIDSGNLGLKVGALRPDLIIMDDIEPGEANYSGHMVGKRLSTVQDVILPLNVNASVQIVGTVTMPGSIMHQLVRSVHRHEDEPVEEWINDERIVVHYHPPIITEDDGTERSIWPGRWSMDFLNAIRHTRSFAKNYANDPRGMDGAYWTDEDFRVTDAMEGVTRRILSLDPSVTTKKSSDPTGLAVLAYRPVVKRAGQPLRPAMVRVEHAEEVRLTGRKLRAHVLAVVERWEAAGTPIGGLLIETNQGGDLWEGDVFDDFPVPVRTLHQSSSKEVRAAEALAYYQRHQVEHAPGLRSAEEQMIGFPSAPHDDMVDAIGSGVVRLLEAPAPKARAGASSRSYV